VPRVYNVLTHYKLLALPTESSAAKKKRDKEFEDELPRKKRLAGENDSEDGRCENDDGVRGDCSDDSSHLCSSSDESDSVEVISKSITSCSTSSSSAYSLVEV